MLVLPLDVVPLLLVPLEAVPVLVVPLLLVPVVPLDVLPVLLLPLKVEPLLAVPVEAVPLDVVPLLPVEPTPSFPCSRLTCRSCQGNNSPAHQRWAHNIHTSRPDGRPLTAIRQCRTADAYLLHTVHPVVQHTIRYQTLPRAILRFLP